MRPTRNTRVRVGRRAAQKRPPDWILGGLRAAGHDRFRAAAFRRAVDIERAAVAWTGADAPLLLAEPGGAVRQGAPPSSGRVVATRVDGAMAEPASVEPDRSTTARLSIRCAIARLPAPPLRGNDPQEAREAARPRRTLAGVVRAQRLARRGLAASPPDRQPARPLPGRSLRDPPHWARLLLRRRLRLRNAAWRDQRLRVGRRARRTRRHRDRRAVSH